MNTITIDDMPSHVKTALVQYDAQIRHITSLLWENQINLGSHPREEFRRAERGLDMAMGIINAYNWTHPEAAPALGPLLQRIDVEVSQQAMFQKAALPIARC